jgi:adenosine deaminase CECR1
MTADSPKKRKRAFSPLPGRKVSIQIGRAKSTTMQVDSRGSRDIFDEMLVLPSAVEAYNKSHDELTEKEELNAWDREVRPKATSTSKLDEVESDAARILRVLREYERKTTFGNLPSEAIPGPETLDMGGQFLTNKDRIETRSMVYQIAHMVPKGALLHLHFNAELSPELLLEQAKNMDTMYIRSIRPLLTEQDLFETEMVFSVLASSDVEANVDIFSPEYPGTGTNWKQDEWKRKVWMKWSIFQRQFMIKFPKAGGQEPLAAPEGPQRICCGAPRQIRLNPAETWLKSKMVLSLEEAYGSNQTVNGYVHDMASHFGY